MAFAHTALSSPSLVSASKPEMGLRGSPGGVLLQLFATGLTGWVTCLREALSPLLAPSFSPTCSSFRP